MNSPEKTPKPEKKKSLKPIKVTAKYMLYLFD
jgi:hypothetical protein